MVIKDNKKKKSETFQRKVINGQLIQIHHAQLQDRIGLENMKRVAPPGHAGVGFAHQP